MRAKGRVGLGINQHDSFTCLGPSALSSSAKGSRQLAASPQCLPALPCERAPFTLACLSLRPGLSDLLSRKHVMFCVSLLAGTGKAGWALASTQAAQRITPMAALAAIARTAAVTWQLMTAAAAVPAGPGGYSAVQKCWTWGCASLLAAPSSC